jgi:glycosyltransferase involved in cell wall biosynthesis
MRVCLVSAEVAPFIGGGLATYIVEMGAALRDAGHEVHVLTGPVHDLKERSRKTCPNVEFHAIRPDEGKAALPGAYYCDSSRWSMAAFEALRRLEREVGAFDYIEFPEYQGHGYWPIRAKRTLGDFANTVLGVRLHMPLYVAREWDRCATLPMTVAHVAHMERVSACEADVIVGASEAVLSRVHADLQALRPKRDIPPMRLIRLPLSLPAKPPTGGDESAGQGAEPDGTRTPEVLCFGRIQRFKGTDVVVEAAVALLERGLDARFRLVGSDTLTGPFARSMTEWLASRIPAHHRERIVFEPPRPRPEVRAMVRAATACVFASRWESFCYAAVEAMSEGACVVVSDGGSLAEIVRDDVDGIVTRAGDARSLADGMERALGDAMLRRRLGECARSRAIEISDPARIAGEVERMVAEVRSSSRSVSVDVRPAARDITVVIPCYNVGRYLPETLESLHQQTCRGFQVIIVDDGSTDAETLSLLDTLRSEGYTVLRKPNGGLGSARNHGFRHAHTEWIIPLDGDDIAHPRFVERLYEAVRRDPGLVAASCMFESFSERPGVPVSGYVPLANDPDLLLFHNIAGPGAASILRRDVVLDVGGYDEYLTSFEDWDLWCTLAERGYRTTVIPEFLLFYRLRPGSLIRSEATPRLHELKAYLISRHPRLATDPSVPLRMYLAEAMHWYRRATELEQEIASLRTCDNGHDVQVEVKRVISENLRYRIADGVRDAMVRLGVKEPAKKALLKARGWFRS